MCAVLVYFYPHANDNHHHTSHNHHHTSHHHRATTHSDLQLRALELNIPVKVIHNASIMNAIGAVGLQLYRYGEVGESMFS